MRKIIALIVALLLLAGCGQQTAPSPAQETENQPLRVVTSIFPQHDFIRQIAGDKVELTMLLSPGAESHSFEPTPRDIITLNNADLFIYVYGGAEVWVYPILASLERENIYTVALVDLVETVDQEIVEGMEDGHHHHHDHDHHHGHSHDHSRDEHHHDHDHSHQHDEHEHSRDHGHEHDHDHDYDPYHDEDEHSHDHGHENGHDHGHHLDEHVWTSPRNAIIIVEQLTEILAQLDPDNADFFRANAAAYITELEALDQAFAEVVAGGVRRTIVVGDRFPFRYLADAYGLSYHAAFTGCATDTQASPATIAFLINKVNEENIPVVFHIEFSCRQIVNVVAEATGARILELHSVHNVSHADFTAGVTYLDLMTRNLEKLREALS